MPERSRRTVAYLCTYFWRVLRVNVEYPAVDFNPADALEELTKQALLLYRDFPWRKTVDAWKILVSEVMLQQTQTTRVIAKYNEWFTALPDVYACANAEKQEILRLWSGLGYNSRALRLHQCAKIICETCRGIVPRFRHVLMRLPGIGAYTSGAVCAFAYDEPHVFFETNIRTVLIYWLTNHPDWSLQSTGVSDVYLKPMLESLVKLACDTKFSIRTLYYMLMDYGAYIKKTQGNLSVLSKAYSKQGKFKGSVREVRGAIIKALSREGTIRYTMIEDQYDPEKVKEAVSALVAEGIIIQKDEVLVLS